MPFVESSAHEAPGARALAPALPRSLGGLVHCLPKVGRMVATPSDFRVDPERTELTDGRSLTLKAACNVLRQLTECGLLEWEGRAAETRASTTASRTWTDQRFVLNRVIDQVKVQVSDSVFADKRAIGYFFCIDFAK